MTIDTYSPPTTELALTPIAQSAAIQRLGEWARSADAAHHVAETLVQTSFCPDQFRGKAGEATAAILAGLEVGLQPMAALRAFDIIQGAAAPKAITLRAVVQSHGHELELVESNATRCKMRGRRRGASSWQEVVWTIDRAKQLGVATKPNWRNQPQAMLVARATSELARLVASDAILGIGYTVEELADGATEQMAEAPVNGDGPPGTRRMSRRPAEPTGIPEVTVEESEDVQPDSGYEPSEPDPEPLLLNTSSKLAKAMYAAIHDHGIPEDERIAWLGNVIGRDITSSKEMLEDEARAVLAFIDEQNAASG